VKQIKANTVLPTGGKLLRRVLDCKIGGWVQMKFDAKVERFGLTWYRVKDGMGRNGDREDWVLDIPTQAVSIHDYQWREPRWGFEKYNSFDEAALAQMVKGLDQAESRAAEFRRDAALVDASVAILKRAIGRGGKP
jgi:hypothetical protein